MRIAYFGGEWSYTHRAARIYFDDLDGKSNEFVPCKFISDVFQVTGRPNGCEYGVVPLENSIEGYVNETYDQLPRTTLQMYGNLLMRINHRLAAVKVAANGKSPILSDIKEAYSHLNALGQVREFLRSYNIEPVQKGDTATSAKMVAEMRSDSIAAVCTEEAANQNGLNILATGINDPSNVTEFRILSSKRATAMPDTTFLTISVSDSVGSLADIMYCFKYAGVNLNDLYKRPVLEHGKRNVVFNVECGVGGSDPLLGMALRMLLREKVDIKYITSFRKSKIPR